MSAQRPRRSTASVMKNWTHYGLASPCARLPHQHIGSSRGAHGPGLADAGQHRRSPLRNGRRVPACSPVANLIDVRFALAPIESQKEVREPAEVRFARVVGDLFEARAGRTGRPQPDPVASRVRFFGGFW